MELSRDWRKASYSSGNGGACIETGNTGRGVAVRDSKQDGQPDRDMLAFAPAQWQAFTRSLKSK
jgi:hypothetical protein